MQYCAEPAETVVETIPRRRRCPRQTLRTLAYVNLNEGNGGIIRDIAETGMAVQAVGALRAGQEVSLRFDLLSPRVRVDARGRVAWADPSGQAGIELLEPTPRARRALRDWLLTQMLSSAVISGRDSIFSVVREDELTFSPTAPAPIILQPVAAGVSPAVVAAQTWFKLSERTFAMLLDTVVLLCAVLLFSISSIVVMGGVPAWPLAVPLLITTATIFVAVYLIIFSDSLCGATPGARLARMASSSRVEEDIGQRFR
jgi:PilZ domain/RDD family